jgi:hypothetical protein
MGRAHVRPFGQIGLAEDDGAGRAQPFGDEGIAAGAHAVQRQRTGAGAHLVGGGDVVLQQDRDPVQRAAQLAGLAFAVEFGAICSASGFSSMTAFRRGPALSTAAMRAR